MERIEVLRREIDEIDRGILDLLEERVKAVKEMGKVKRELGVGIEDVEREAGILENISGSTALDKEFVRYLFRKIIDYCKDEE